MNEATIIRQAARILEAKLPPGWEQKMTPSKGPRQLDATLEIIAPDGVKARIVVEAKARLFPRDASNVRLQIERYTRGPSLVIAPFLTPSTRRRLREENLNYLDLTGNMRLIISEPGLCLETTGALEDPLPADPSKRSLRGPKAGRIVRALCDFSVPLNITELSNKAGVDVSYASRLVEWMSIEALLTRAPRGAVQKVERVDLIRRWAEDYSVLKSNEASSFLDPRGLDNLVRGLGRGQFRYAATGSLAANRIAPTAPSRLALIYVDEPDRVAAGLKLQPAESGANVMLLAPFDSVVFERTRTEGNLTYVAPSQAAVDLLTAPGRAPAEAEAILERMQQQPSLF